MKKIQNKHPKTNKTKIELKIKSKNVTNNFILTPRAVSPRSQRDLLSKTDRVVEENKSDRQKLQDLLVLKGVKEGKRQQYRVINTDYTRSNFKRKNEEDQTGTQTPLPRKIVSMVTESMNKKKSSNSLIHTESTKLRKKISDRPIKSQSSQLNKATLQRVIGIIINDFKEGRLKQKQLEQALIELYDRKQKTKTGKKSKRKDHGSATFSNEFLRSSCNNTKSKNKAKKVEYEEQITQKILEREGFVNKIIVKGITTSMFLKDDFNLSNIKQNQVKNMPREQSFNIHTSKSIKEINEEMRIIQQNFNKLQQYHSQTLEDIMATRIQRAWRRFRTRKIVKGITLSQENVNHIHILDQFTDEECNEQEAVQANKAFKTSKAEPNTAANEYANLVKMISDSLQTKNLSKQECLKNILNYLKFPEGLNQIQTGIVNQPTETKQIEVLIKEIQKNEEDDEFFGQLDQSRVKILNFDTVKEKFQDDQNDNKSLEEQANSFTNKYSSKQVDNGQYFKDKGAQQGSQLDKSLTFTHSQTLAAQSFKMINIQNIEEGLQTREQAISFKKEKEIQQLTQQFFNNKISREQYQQQKNKIDKWFKSQQKQLKKVKNSLLKSCYEAKKILQNDLTNLKNQKSKKMLKCLSDKYIKKNDWNNRSIVSQKLKDKRLKCQQQQSLRKTNLGEQSNDDDQVQGGEQQILNLKHSFQESQENEKQELQFQISPKLCRNERLQQQQKQKDYNYQQIQGIIEEQEDGLQQGLNKFQQKVQLISDKMIENNEPFLDEIQDHEFSLINSLVNEDKKKFKYLCTEDKQDIFEFLFLDLVLEMFTQNAHGQSRILRAAEAYINKAKKLKKIPKGIKTNIASSKQYLRVLSQFVLKQKGALKNLSAPMGPSAIEMLKYMRDQIVQADDQQSISSTLVIPLDIFQKVSKLPQLQLKLQRYYDDDQKQLGRLSFLKTALNINNKSLFDSLNEVLDHQRPYGVWGKPFPWKKVLSVDRQWTSQQQQIKMKKSIQKTIEACSYLCGIIVDKQDSLFGSHRVSQEYVLHIRQDRLSKMLANDLVQNEQRWIFYDDEQTQILMDVSSFITKRLIKEVVLEIISLRMRF